MHVAITLMTDNKKEPKDHVLVTHDPVSCEAAARMVHSDSAGATSMFVGECDSLDGDMIGDRLSAN